MVTHTSTKLLFNGENLIKKKFRFPNIVFEFASFTQLSNIYTMIPIPKQINFWIFPGVKSDCYRQAPFV